MYLITISLVIFAVIIAAVLISRRNANHDQSTVRLDFKGEYQTVEFRGVYGPEKLPLAAKRDLEAGKRYIITVDLRKE
jgi:hypothetical protein